MIVLILGSAVLSVVHALLPNHWLPLVLIAQAGRWSLQQTMGYALLAIVAHLLSTIGIGIGIALAGMQVQHWIIQWGNVVGGGVFIALGIYFFLARSHKHWNHNAITAESRSSSKSVLGSVILAMFFSPCIELEAYYVPAAAYGWEAIVAISGVYMLLTTVTVLLLVRISYRGIQKVLRRSHRFESVLHRLMGVIFVILGVILIVVE